MLCGGDVGQLSAAARPCADISTGCPKKKLLLNRILITKLSALGPNYPMDMTWERLIPLSLSKNRLKNNFRKQTLPSFVEIDDNKGCRLLVIEPVHRNFSSIL